MMPQTEYKAKFTYTVAGRQFRGSVGVGSDWEIGRTFELSYDPKNPRRNTASRSFDPYDWRAYVYYAVVWGSAAVLLYLCIRYLPTKSEMIRP